MTVKQFFRTPKGLLTIILVILAIIGSFGERMELVAQIIAGAVIPAAVLDLLILKLRNQAWEFPSGALLTGLIIAMVLSPFTSWHVAAVASIIAVASKYVLRSRTANMLNPAAVGLIAGYYLFHPGESWWGALPEVAPLAILALLAGGIFMTERVNKLPLVIAFLGGYYLLFTVSAFVGNPAHVAEVFRTPDLHEVLYFAFFILTDPPTSPNQHTDQVLCGLIVAFVSFGFFQWVGAVYYLLAGVLVGNVWEAWRRSQARSTPSRKLRTSFP